jgi:hypothetical protein
MVILSVIETPPASKRPHDESGTASFVPIEAEKAYSATGRPKHRALPNACARRSIEASGLGV